MRRLLALALALVASACSSGGSAGPVDLGPPPDLALVTQPSTVPCGAVAVSFRPGAPNLQVAVWVEDAAGKYVDTAYVTRLTGQFGLANRPGAALLKTDFGWPYGRREMVAPVWAHRRNHKYPRITMGGVCGNSPTSPCPTGGLCGGDCIDSTIAYHPRVSSYEPFYCSPSGASTVDAMSCASKGTFSKGAYMAFPDSYSLYPPRADLTNYDAITDSPDVQDFKRQNDLTAVSQATPRANVLVDPPVIWFPPSPLAEGDYVVWMEASQEADFNASHNHPCDPDGVATWQFEGHEFLGQPSIVWKVPFHYAKAGGRSTTREYAGYGSWDGSDGDLRAPDSTITTGQDGTGAGRLLEQTESGMQWRVRVEVGSCP